MLDTLRALLFYAGLLPHTILFALLGIVVRPLPFFPRYWVVTRWTHITLWWLKCCCGLTHHVRGMENIPPGPAIIMCKHQSAWETMALQLIFPPQVWVLKRELLWIPFFGWGLASLEPIALNRRAGHKALRQLVAQGKQRLARGIWVTLFPEGTRTAPGHRRRYNIGGGLLAAETGVPIVPVAHNAGTYWPRLSLRKRPGCIELVIGPVISVNGRDAREIVALAEEWIESTAQALLQESS
ncbi:MAG TPA: lysophospholipid acyltransferase family protein [Gammaproteobacteria bacterium]|nr:lysophospholipid acyltransferase family protein [Gammaproteobacteria bacterium]